MGICTSSGGIEISEDDKQRHREAEKVLKEVSFCFVFAAVGENEWNDGQRSRTLAVIPRALVGTMPECAQKLPNRTEK